MTVEALTARRASGLVDCLVTVVRPEFRVRRCWCPRWVIRFWVLRRARCQGVCGRAATAGCARRIWVDGARLVARIVRRGRPPRIPR